MGGEYHRTSRESLAHPPPQSHVNLSLQCGVWPRATKLQDYSFGASVGQE